jgi:hypothetical protein
MTDAADGVRRRVGGWSALAPDERELEARPVADLLYHLLAGALLLGEGQARLDAAADSRKLLAGGLYLQRWLGDREPGAAPFSLRQMEWLDALADWRAVPSSALAAVHLGTTGERS